MRGKTSYVIIDSTKSGIKFRTDVLTKANAEFMSASTKYDAHQQHIVEEIVRVAAGFVPRLLSVADLVSRLDCLTSSAVAAQAGGVHTYIRRVGNDIF